MQNPALSIAALMGGGDDSTGTRAMLASATVTPEPTTQLTGTQWAWVIVAMFVGYMIQRGRGGFANWFGWILIVGSIIIIIAATLGFYNAVNLVADAFQLIGSGFTAFGELLESSTS